MLFRNGAQLSEHFQNNAILEASREGSVHMVNLLDECGADLNYQNYDKVCCPLKWPGGGALQTAPSQHVYIIPATFQLP
jgi:hypothetical protein